MKNIIKSFAAFLAISLLVSACSRKTESTVPVSEPISVDARAFQ
jgi:predicted small lipoprotein YifL